MRALVTGVTGQDGYYLSELLIQKGYEVVGMIRRRATSTTTHLNHAVSFVEGDLTDQSSLDKVIADVKPNEVYNLAAQSFVPTSFTHPVMTADVTGLGMTRLLEAVRKYRPDARVYQASSSEMFGNAPHSPQNEETPFNPQSPYGVAKVYAHLMARHYRSAYNMFVACGICFNHESERRGADFVTRKISLAVGKIARGEQAGLKLGNPHALRDWGHAEDYVRGMWMMLQQHEPSDYVLATGQTHSVKEFARQAFEVAGLDADEFCVWDVSLYRPGEVNQLCGDAFKARKVMGWEPEIEFQTLVKRMVEHDLVSRTARI